MQEMRPNQIFFLITVLYTGINKYPYLQLPMSTNIHVYK